MSLLRRFFSMMLLAVACIAIAQRDDMDASFKRATPAEEAKLRTILAEPMPIRVPNATLPEHFQIKRNAAERLGAINAKIAIYEQ